MYNRVKLSFLFCLFSLFLCLSSFFAKDTAAQDWNQKTDMINPRLFFSTSAVGNEIYVIGGMLGNPIDSVEAYVPKADTWEKRASLTSERAGVVTCQVGGKLYAIGGWDAQNPALGTLEEYNPKTNKWTHKADMPTPRSFFSVGVVDGKIYAMGGIAQNVGPVLAVVEEYDPSTDTWTKKSRYAKSTIWRSCCRISE